MTTDADGAEDRDAKSARRIDKLEHGKASGNLRKKMRLRDAKRYSFNQLMAKVTKENTHSEIKTGPARGNESL